MIRLLQIAISLFLAFNASAALVTIGGAAKDYVGARADLYLYDDFVTNFYILANSQVVDTSGKFSFAMDIEEVKMAFIRIDGINGKLFLQPGGTYAVDFPKLPGMSGKAIHNRSFVELLFNDLSETDINYLLIDYNADYEKFFADNYGKLAEYKRSGRIGYQESMGKVKEIHQDSVVKKTDNPMTFDELIGNFHYQMKEKYKAISNPYFDAYVQYSFAAIRTSAVVSKKRAFQEYIAGKPIQFNHHEYMAYLDDFFDGHLYKRVTEEINDSLGGLVHTGQHYDQIVRILQRDDFLHDRELCEYVVVEGLFRGFYTQDYPREAVIRLVREASEKSEFPAIQKIAGNMFGLLTRLRKGYPAYNFELKDKEGKMVKLSDFKGKYIYLGFYASWCTPCIAEMKAIPEFHKKYSADIAMVSVSLDNSEQEMTQFLQTKKDFNWTFLHHANQPELQDQYDIQAVPAFVFIDPEGKIISARELKPSEIVEQKFFDIHKVLHPKTKFRVGGEPPEKTAKGDGLKRR